MEKRLRAFDRSVEQTTDLPTWSVVRTGTSKTWKKRLAE